MNNDTGKNDGSANTKTMQSAMAAANPGLYKSVRKALKNQTLNFKINVECTSLKVSPSGNFLWGGFSDGTLRVWDLSGTFGIEHDDVIASRQKTDVLVNSKLTQGYGAVACQIHARGVHTDLITTIDISDDARYVFVGVARGAVELYAVFVGDLERAVHTHKQQSQQQPLPKKNRNILDYLKVYCHSDAKLKGFGACATMRVANPQQQGEPSYLLLTGKGIKNIHIWKFTPPNHGNSSESSDDDDDDSYTRQRRESICDPPEDEEDNGIWDQLYDTATNGNSILLLGFHRDPQNKLLAVSKSDRQKLRLWDLSAEESNNHNANNRPKRPPYQDVANSQSVLELAGGIGVCGGGNMYNEMSIVSLDRPNDPFNHTDLALPSAVPSDGEPSYNYSSRRQRRGEMKVVVTVAASPRDSSHALLQLDDGSLVGYSAGSSSGSSTSKDSSSGSIPKLAIATPESTGIPALPADFWRRCICLANIAGVVIAASSLYNPNTNKGQLVIRALGGLKRPRGSEFDEKKKLKQQQRKWERERERLEEERLEEELLKEEQRLEQERLKKERTKRERIERERKLLLVQQQERQRQKAVQQVKAAVVAPKTPSPIHTNLQASPDTADKEALRDAVSAPKPVQVSEHRTNKTKSIDRKEETFGVSNTLATQPSASASLTRVSPNSTMETPKHRNTSTHVLEDTPDSSEGLPKISKFLQPKRIDMQAIQLEKKPKKRGNEQQSNEVDTVKAASSAAPSGKQPPVAKKARLVEPLVSVLKTPQATNSTEAVTAAPAKKPKQSPGMFELNSIGSVPFKSPAPKTIKQKKVSAPMKPKKLKSFIDTPTVSTTQAEKRTVVVSTPTAKVSTTTTERKRDRESSVPEIISKKITRSTDDMSMALLLTELGSPKSATTGKSTEPTGMAKAVTKVIPKGASAESSKTRLPVKSTGEGKFSGDPSRSKNITSIPATKITPNSSSKSKGKSSTPPNKSSTSQNPIPSREEILHEKISEQYKQLRSYLQGFTEKSMAFIHSRNLRGPVPSALAGSAKSSRVHVNAYAKLLVEHRAAHDYLQRRLLRSAETTLRLLLESRITAEEARTELKQSIKKFEEILCDTLHRQETERLAVVAQYYGRPSNFARKRGLQDDDKNRPSESAEDSDYPCKKAFDKVEEICIAITRPPGRPRSALSALR